MMRASLMAQWVNNLPAIRGMQEMQIRSLGWEDLLEEEVPPTPAPVLLLEKSYGQNGQRNLTGYIQFKGLQRVRHG